MCRSSSGSEIYDLAWSPDGTFFVTGSMDNVARIYNATNGKLEVVFLDTHVHSADFHQVKLFGRSQSTTTTCKALHGIRSTSL